MASEISLLAIFTREQTSRMGQSLGDSVQLGSQLIAIVQRQRGPPQVVVWYTFMWIPTWPRCARPWHIIHFWWGERVSWSQVQRQWGFSELPLTFSTASYHVCVCARWWQVPLRVCALQNMNLVTGPQLTSIVALEDSCFISLGRVHGPSKDTHHKANGLQGGNHSWWPWKLKL